MRNAWSVNINFAKKVNKQVHFKKLSTSAQCICTAYIDSLTLSLSITIMYSCSNVTHSNYEAINTFPIGNPLKYSPLMLCWHIFVFFLSTPMNIHNKHTWKNTIINSYAMVRTQRQPGSIIQQPMDSQNEARCHTPTLTPLFFMKEAVIHFATTNRNN